MDDRQINSTKAEYGTFIHFSLLGSLENDDIFITHSSHAGIAVHMYTSIRCINVYTAKYGGELYSILCEEIVVAFLGFEHPILFEEFAE